MMEEISTILFRGIFNPPKPNHKEQPSTKGISPKSTIQLLQAPEKIKDQRKQKLNTKNLKTKKGDPPLRKSYLEGKN